jgi:hypothetical protein
MLALEAGRKALDIDKRGKHSTDKATCVGSLDVTLQGKTNIGCSGSVPASELGS